RSPSRSKPSTSPRIGPTSSSPAPFRERRNKRLRIVGGALGGIAVATSGTQRQRCAALEWGTSQDIPFSLLGVIRLDAECHQILRAHGLSKRIPQLLENNYQLLGLNALFPRLGGNFLQQIGQLRGRTLRPSQLLGQSRSQLLHGAF